MNEVPSPKAPARTITRIVSFISLYVASTSFLTFIFSVIDYAFPDNTTTNIFFSVPPYDLVQKTFPVFVVSLAIFIASILLLRNKNVFKDNTAYSLGWRRFIYTVFLIIGASYILTIIEEISNWLQGELFSRFILKLVAFGLAIFCVAIYYVREFRGVWASDTRKHNIFVWSVCALSILTVFASFAIVGTPSFHKSLALDMSRRSDVEGLKRAVECGCNQGVLPADSEVNNTDNQDTVSAAPSRYADYLKDNENKPVTYKKLGNNQFQICAAFANDSSVLNKYVEDGYIDEYYTGPNIKWSYTKNGCQTFTFDPQHQVYNPFNSNINDSDNTDTSDQDSSPALDEGNK